MKKIKIELELDPTIAFMLGTFIHQTAQGSMEVYAMMTDKGRKQILEVGQEIIDQVGDKSDIFEMESK